MKLFVASILGAFQETCVGTKVVHPRTFTAIVEKAVESHDFTSNPQAFITLTSAAVDCVAPGVGRRSVNDHESDYVVRMHRGRPEAFLRRQYASEATAVSVVVYTAAAYLADPEVSQNERELVVRAEATHVLVAVIAHCGPRAPLTPYRLVANLAGGNLAYGAKTAEEMYTEAREVIKYDNEWCVVAD